MGLTVLVTVPATRWIVLPPLCATLATVLPTLAPVSLKRFAVSLTRRLNLAFAALKRLAVTLTFLVIACLALATLRPARLATSRLRRAAALAALANPANLPADLLTVVLTLPAVLRTLRVALLSPLLILLNTIF